MKKALITTITVFFYTLAIAQPASQISAAFYAKYPRVPSGQCAGCTLEVNPYFSTITDEKLGQAIVTYANYTSQKEAQVVKLKVSESVRNWQPYPGDADETKFYTDINKGITNSQMKYAKGHYVAFILCAYTTEGAIISCTYKINEGIENQGQNEGTELEVESLTRALVGSTSADAKKVHYTGPAFARVDYWKGSWGSQKVLNMDGITRNYSAVYWNLLKYGGQVHAYWFLNNISASKGYQGYEIPYDHNDPDFNKKGLIQRLGFDPAQLIKPTAN
jgi:hypothetical protein